jgi:hypothetical protein
VQTIEQRGLKRRLIEVNVLLDPGHVFQRAVFLHVLGRTPAVPQQELAQAVTSTVLILAGVSRARTTSRDRLPEPKLE